MACDQYLGQLKAADEMVRQLRKGLPVEHAIFIYEKAKEFFSDEGSKRIQSKILQRERLELLDQIEQAFTACTHPHVSTEGADADVMWCNLCGAILLSKEWLRPHWRDILMEASK